MFAKDPDDATKNRQMIMAILFMIPVSLRTSKLFAAFSSMGFLNAKPSADVARDAGDR